MAYGVEKSSGNTVLVSLEEPINKLSAKRDTLEPLAYKVIARGLSAPSQGAGNSVIYWRTGKLWRYTRGNYRQISEADDPTTQSPTIYEAQVAPDAESVRATQIVNSRPTPEGNYPSAVWSYDSPVPSREGYSSEPIGWIDATRLLVREYRNDKIGRLQASKFFIAIADPATPEAEAKREELTNLETSIQELSAAISKTKVAISIYDEKREEFNLGIRNLTDESKQVKWVPLPVHPKRGTEFYKNFLSQSRILDMAWSPSGRYLQINTSSLAVSLWDDQEKKWVQTGSLIIFSGSDGAPLLWIDEDQVVTLQRDMPGLSQLLIKSVSRPNVLFTSIGSIKGIEVQKLFIVALPNTLQ